MRKLELIEFLRGKLGQGPPDNPGDVAAKLYFYDVGGALLTDEQWRSFFRRDGLYFRGSRRQLLAALCGELSTIARQICGPKDYLTVILYGIVCGDRIFDVFANMGEEGKVHMGLMSYAHEATPQVPTGR